MDDVQHARWYAKAVAEEEGEGVEMGMVEGAGRGVGAGLEGQSPSLSEGGGWRGELSRESTLWF